MFNSLPARIKGYALHSFEYYRFNGMVLEVPYSDSLARALANSKFKIAYSSQDSNLLIVGRLRGGALWNDIGNLKKNIHGRKVKAIYRYLIFMNIIIFLELLALIVIH